MSQKKYLYLICMVIGNSIPVFIIISARFYMSIFPARSDVKCVCISADGLLLASCSSDGVKVCSNSM